MANLEASNRVGATVVVHVHDHGIRWGAAKRDTYSEQRLRSDKVKFGVQNAV